MTGGGLFLRCALAFVAFAGLTAPAPRALDKKSADNALHVDFAALEKDRALVQLVSGTNAVILDTGAVAQEINAAIPLTKASLPAMAGFSVINRQSSQYASALRCLTQAVYYEAANESAQGKRAVAQVVINRVRHPAYPASVCGVVYEGYNKPVCQFSFVCDGSLTRAPARRQWNESEQVSREALAGKVEGSVGSATHYHADYVVPRWAYTLGKVKQIGAHLFYRFPGSAGERRAFAARWSGREAIPQLDFSRLEVLAETEIAETVDLAATHVLPPDPTDRRAANDIGGRMDPSKQWRLAIPDPVKANSTLRQTLANQGEPQAETIEGGA